MRKVAWLVCAAITMAVPALAQQTEWNPEQAAQEAAAPEHPITVEQVHEMMKLSGYENLKKQSMSVMSPYLKQAMPYLPADVLDDFQDRMAKADLEPTIVQSYQAHLSTEDAAQIIAFYRTPAGQRMIAVIPQIMKENEQAGARLGQETMAQVIEAHKAEIEEALKKYQQQHPAATANQ
jgi:hypothetical protein